MENKIRRFKSKCHVTINNSIMKERDVTLKAKGLYALVMSLPDDWDFSIKGICAITKENYTAVNAAINELIKAGYCRRERVKENGKFVGCDYEFSEVKTGSPHSGFLNVENPRVENLNDNNINSTINSPLNKDISTINSPDKKENKKLSNDNENVEFSFDLLWKKYHKGSKQAACTQWLKLRDKERERALNTIDDYLTYCRRSNRPLKDCSSYLCKKFFNDDWNIVPDCYTIKESDDDRHRNFKEWMCKDFPDLIYHRNPLTFEQAVELFDMYNIGDVKEAMRKLCSIDIHQYFNIKSGIEKVLNDEIGE